MRFVFNNLSAFYQLISNNPFVFIYFLASFRLPPCVFNNILASVVLFFVCSDPSFPRAPGRSRLYLTRPSIPAPSGDKTSHIDNHNRLSLASALVKRKARNGLTP